MPGGRGRRPRDRRRRSDRNEAPAFMRLAFDIGLAGFSLGIERVEFEIEIMRLQMMRSPLPTRPILCSPSQAIS
jgi:hypothetical protein